MTRGSLLPGEPCAASRALLAVKATSSFCPALSLSIATWLQVFVTATARCLDIGTVLASESGCIVLVSPSTKPALLERFNKYIFPSDDVKVGGRSSLQRFNPTRHAMQARLWYGLWYGLWCGLWWVLLVCTLHQRTKVCMPDRVVRQYVALRIESCPPTPPCRLWT